jgi:hypothetical protein
VGSPNQFWQFNAQTLSDTNPHTPTAPNPLFVPWSEFSSIGQKVTWICTCTVQNVSVQPQALAPDGLTWVNFDTPTTVTAGSQGKFGFYGGAVLPFRLQITAAVAGAIVTAWVNTGG